MATKVNKEVAISEFENWLDFKRVREKKREDNAESEALILECMEVGLIVINENKELIFKLQDPITNQKGDTTLESVTFMPRLKVSEANAKLMDVKTGDVHGTMLAYIAAATQQNKKFLAQMDTSDYSICQAIITYFL